MCVSTVKIIVESVKIIACNKVVFTSIMALTTLPLSTLIITQSLATHTLSTQIHHLEALAHRAPTRFEARHVWRESRNDAISLLRTKALFALPSYLLSLAAVVSAVHSALLASHATTPTLRSAASALAHSWKRPLATTIFVYAILLAISPIPRFLSSLTGSRFLLLAIGWCVEVYLMAVLSLGLVVSVAEERFGWDAIRVGSALMEGRRLCGWLLSVLLVAVSGLILSKVEQLMDGQDYCVGEKAIVICWYGLAVLLSYVIMTVFYCDCRRRHPIREPQPHDEELQPLSL